MLIIIYLVVMCLILFGGHMLDSVWWSCAWFCFTLSLLLKQINLFIMDIFEVGVGVWYIYYLICLILYFAVFWFVSFIIWFVLFYLDWDWHGFVFVQIDILWLDQFTDMIGGMIFLIRLDTIFTGNFIYTWGYFDFNVDI